MCLIMLGVKEDVAMEEEEKEVEATSVVMKEVKITLYKVEEVQDNEEREEI